MEKDAENPHIKENMKLWKNIKKRKEPVNYERRRYKDYLEFVE